MARRASIRALGVPIDMLIVVECGECVYDELKNPAFNSAAAVGKSVKLSGFAGHAREAKQSAIRHYSIARSAQNFSIPNHQLNFKTLAAC